MELGLRLSQKQTLKLVMTPRLQQALKLLQMPSLELSQHIEQELLTNPLLELEEESPDSTSEAASTNETPAETQDEASSPAADRALREPSEKSIGTTSRPSCSAIRGAANPSRTV